jgi:hypothetical protein
VNDEETPLTQFQEWYDSRDRAALDSQSEYAKFREAFFAGFAARPRPPIEPSRDALIEKTSRLARYYREAYVPNRGQKDVPWMPAPEFTQHGTITGRFPRRDPDKGRRMAEAYGVEPVAGPSPETLERIHTKLTQDGVVEYPEPPADFTNPGFPAVTRADTQLMPTTPGFEYTETVWEPRYGAPGPVPTPLGIQDDGNG